MDLTQQQIADHLGLSQQQVSAWLERLDLTVEAGLDRIRLAYIEALRAAAAAQTPSEEREAMFRARRGLAELKLGREKGALVEAEGVRRAATVTARTVRDSILDIHFRLDPMLAGISSPHERSKLWDRELRLICRDLIQAIHRAGGVE